MDPISLEVSSVTLAICLDIEWDYEQENSTEGRFGGKTASFYFYFAYLSHRKGKVLKIAHFERWDRDWILFLCNC